MDDEEKMRVSDSLGKAKNFLVFKVSCKNSLRISFLSGCTGRSVTSNMFNLKGLLFCFHCEAMEYIIRSIFRSI